MIGANLDFARELKIMFKEWLERILFVIIGLCLGFISAFLWECSTRKIGYLAHQFGFHFHHSIFGLISYAFVPLFWRKKYRASFLIGFGTGIIIEHTLYDGFWFITYS